MSLRTPLVIAGTAVSMAALVACGSTTTSVTPPTPSGAASTAVAPSSGSVSPGPGASGSTADIAFAQLMIPHHEQAVQMADMALDPAHGASPQVQALAKRIQGAQGPEIEQMQGWLTAWGAPSAMASASTDAQGDMAGMDMGGVSQGGMMTESQMSALAATQGQEFDRKWLQMMISHHQGAVSMAKDVLAGSTNPEVTALANAIITGQQEEIVQMQKMLSSPQ